MITGRDPSYSYTSCTSSDGCTRDIVIAVQETSSERGLDSCNKVVARVGITTINIIIVAFAIDKELSVICRAWIIRRIRHGSPSTRRDRSSFRRSSRGV